MVGSRGGDMREYEGQGSNGSREERESVQLVHNYIRTNVVFIDDCAGPRFYILVTF